MIPYQMTQTSLLFGGTPTNSSEAWFCIVTDMIMETRYL